MSFVQELENEDRMFDDLRNNRPLARDQYEKHKQVVMSGYWKLMLFALKPAVKAQADKQLVIR